MIIKNRRQYLRLSINSLGGVVEKQCTQCLIYKPIESFHKETRGLFGRKSKCSECCTKISKKWKIQNADREAENRKRWNSVNKDRHKKSTYKWREENKDAHLAYTAKWQKEKKLSNTNFKLLCSIRSLVSNHFANRGICKTKNLESLLGINWTDFKNHIISMLETEMTEQNYGDYWSFDHICPCSIALNKEELEKLQHWSNWRPMVHKENLLKSNKITKEAEEICLQLLNRRP